MPFAPPRLCACGKIVPSGEQCACQRDRTRARNKRHDRRRGSASERGYNHEWRKARTAFLAEFPWCVMCMSKATVVDHIRPHKGNDLLFWERTNWQPLCARCHNRRKQKAERTHGA